MSGYGSGLYGIGFYGLDLITPIKFDSILPSGNFNLRVRSGEFIVVIPAGHVNTTTQPISAFNATIPNAAFKEIVP